MSLEKRFFDFSLIEVDGFTRIWGRLLFQYIRLLKNFFFYAHGNS